MTNQLSVNDIQLITYKNIPVVPSEILACVYGTTPQRIRQNFKKNYSKFELEKHYYKLTGKELTSFKNDVALSDVVNFDRRINHILLWTERGAARHAKMLETDEAWEVFEALEDNYFRRQQPQPIAQEQLANTLPAPINTETLKQLNALFFQLSGKKSIMVNESDLFNLLRRTKAFETQITELANYAQHLNKSIQIVMDQVGYTEL